jgi:hypothetical protein
LTKDDLRQQSVCPHCKFRPKDEQHVHLQSLEELEEQVQALLDNWTSILLGYFNDPEVKENINLLKPEQQRLINELLNKKEFELPIDLQLIHAIKELLQGIEKVQITMEGLMKALGNGNPITVEEARRGFERLLSNSIGSQPTNRVRIMLENK